MTNNQSSYRQIFKATSLFGGVQIFNIVISIVRSKFIAVLLGPAGMGIAGLLTSTLKLIEGISGFGLGISAVKNVASAHATEDNNKIAVVVSVLKRLVWITGILGAILTFAIAHLLSRLTFGSPDYTIAFKWIAITLLFNQLSIGRVVILRGLRQLNLMAKSTLIGSLVGLLASLPLYYLYRIDGIVPAIIISSFISLLLTWFFSSKVKIEKSAVDFRAILNEGRNMVGMGFILSLSSLMTLGASYVIRVFINLKGGVEQVGLYNAGFTIINIYVGLVFDAMATDYYPRLSSVANDNKKASLLINQQAEVAILILAPILSIFIVFINWIIIILYSAKFVAINEMIHWAVACLKENFYNPLGSKD